MRLIILIFLSFLSLDGFSEEYLCSLNNSVQIIERNQQGVKLKTENSESTYEVLREDEQVLIFLKFNDFDGNLITIDLRSMDKNSYELTIYSIFPSLPEYNSHSQGKCILND